MAEVFRINVDCLAEGQMLDVECAAYKGKCVVYVIKAGDMLATISAAFGTTVKAIVTLNNIQNPDRIMVGQKIVVPKVK